MKYEKNEISKKNMKVQNETNQTRKCVASVELATMSPTMAFKNMRCENVKQKFKE